MKLFLGEDDSAVARALWNSDASCVTSWITFAEARAAIAAARRSRRLTRIGSTAAMRALEANWGTITPLVVDGAVARTAGAMAVRHRLRALDAVHLACALPLLPAPAVFVTFDGKLAGAARDEGFAVAGAV